MNKTILLIKHEFLSTIRRKAFIILTIAFPLIALLGILAGQVIPGMITPTTTVEKIGYVDQVGIFNQSLTENKIELVPYATADAAKTDLTKKNIKEYFVIGSDYLTTGIIQRYTLTSEIAPSSTVQTVIRDFMLNNLLKGNSEEIIARAKSPLNIASTTLTSTGTVSYQTGRVFRSDSPLYLRHITDDGHFYLLRLFTAGFGGREGKSRNGDIVILHYAQDNYWQVRSWVSAPLDWYRLLSGSYPPIS